MMYVAASAQELVRNTQGTAAAVAALQAHLRSMRDVIEAMDEDAYRAKPSRMSGSIGGHVRHCLDHASALLAATADRDLSYDSRLRGTPVETDPLTAMIEIDRLCVELDDLDERSMGCAIRLRSATRRDEPAASVTSSLGREIVFVVQHTIHHCAMIAILLEQIGIAAPADFGYAPTTPIN